MEAAIIQNIMLPSLLSPLSGGVTEGLTPAGFAVAAALAEGSGVAVAAAVDPPSVGAGAAVDSVFI